MQGGVPAPGRVAERFARAREDPALVVLEGFHALKHALRFGAAVELAVASEDVLALARDLAPDVEPELAQLVRPVPRAQLRALVAREPHTRVLAIAERPPPAPWGDGPVVALEDPRHMGNVGAVVRVAAAADAGAVVTTGAADPWHPAALRGSAGLHFALPVERAESIAARQGRPLIALDPAGEPLDSEPLAPRAILAFGSERSGLSAELLDRADARVRIPMRAGVSSLNLATAVAAVLFRSTRRA